MIIAIIAVQVLKFFSSARSKATIDVTLSHADQITDQLSSAFVKPNDRLVAAAPRRTQSPRGLKLFGSTNYVAMVWATKIAITSGVAVPIMKRIGTNCLQFTDPKIDQRDLRMQNSRRGEPRNHGPLRTRGGGVFAPRTLLEGGTRSHDGNAASDSSGGPGSLEVSH